MILEFWCVDGGTHPIIGKVWYKMPRCVVEGAERYDRYLCSALFMTMHTPDDCVQGLSQLDSVQNGQSKETAFGINDTQVTFTDRGAQVDILIEDEIGTADGLFTLAEFRNSIVAWEEFLRAQCTQEYSVKVDISQ
jgi:hypothetical protein